MSLVSKPAPAKSNRRLGAIVAYTTLACSLVSIGVYVYRQQKKQRSNGSNSSSGDQNSTTASGRTETSRSHGSGAVDNQPTESTSSLSKLGSRIARTVKRNRKVMTISIKNTIVWNPSPDPTTPNYGFVEGVVPLLFHLAENYNLHLILLCPSSQQAATAQQLNGTGRMSNGKTRTLSIEEEEALKAKEQLGREREKEQILTMLANVGLTSPPGSKGSAAANNSLIDPRRFLICQTEEGISHVVRHLESQVHVDASREVVELVQGVIPRVVHVDRRPSAAALAAAAAAAAKQHHPVTNGRRISSSSTSSTVSSSSTGGDLMTRSNMDGSFINVSHTGTATPQKEPLVSGYVTQAGKKGYVEVVDSLLKSSLHPDTTHR